MTFRNYYITRFSYRLRLQDQPPSLNGTALHRAVIYLQLSEMEQRKMKLLFFIQECNTAPIPTHETTSCDREYSMLVTRPRSSFVV